MKQILFIWLIYNGMSVTSADPLVVAAGENFGVNTISVDEIREIYTGKQYRLNDNKIIPLNLGVDNPLRKKFEQNILNENKDTLAQYWLQAHYLGHHTPKVFKSQESVAEFLSKVDNSLGYIDEEIAQKYHLKILFRAKE
jgi:ABC-type phosphate transport system substrate-binding protein